MICFNYITGSYLEHKQHRKKDLTLTIVHSIRYHSGFLGIKGIFHGKRCVYIKIHIKGTQFFFFAYNCALIFFHKHSFGFLSSWNYHRQKGFNNKSVLWEFFKLHHFFFFMNLVMLIWLHFFQSSLGKKLP